MEGADGPKWLQVPSIDQDEIPAPEPGQTYHDLGSLYPDAPVPRTKYELVIRRAVLHDLSGMERLLNWVSEGEMAIVEFRSLLDRELEFETTVEKLSSFIEGDMGGSLVQLGENRILLLPPGVIGVAGLESETFHQDA